MLCVAWAGSRQYVASASDPRQHPARPGRAAGVQLVRRRTPSATRRSTRSTAVDLDELGLPFMDEPNHPRLRRYEHQHTKDWSARVDAADAFVLVTPEYNHSFSAPLKNAIDFLHNEWAYKPVGFASYGGIAAGTRALQALKPVVGALRMTAVVEAVNIPFVGQFIDEDEQFRPNDVLDQAADAMLAELCARRGGVAPAPGAGERRRPRRADPGAPGGSPPSAARAGRRRRARRRASGPRPSSGRSRPARRSCAPAAARAACSRASAARLGSS